MGSPPRMRGKLGERIYRPVLSGITPACAGKTLPGASRRGHPWDHPRMCGENKANPRSSPRHRGSPPRVRGKRSRRAALRGGLRITPACAGKTRRQAVLCWDGRDHPRVCGENSTLLRKLGGKWGSPPRVRGKQDEVESADGDERITPACAGKTARHRKSAHLRRDHPRVCGENTVSPISSAARRGSPPRVRGKLLVEQQRQRLGRITPACAGKTYRKETVYSPSRDHPRVCGENYHTSGHRPILQGSPPRVRGKHGPGLQAGIWQRITPACAGKTLFVFSTPRSTWDHPRVCGENYIYLADTYRVQGSPPRVRGKPSLTLILAISFRITPACAGKTIKRNMRGRLF